MSPLNFITWLRGFVEASNAYNITPKQWESICEQLDKVKDNNSYTVEVGTGGAGVVNTTADIRRDITYKNDSLTTNTLLND